MQPYHTNIMRLAYLSILFLGFLLTSCNQSPAGTPATKTSSPPLVDHKQGTATIQSTATSTPATAPARYTSHVVLRGVGRPDDIGFDQQGRLLFSDEFNNTISRLNADGTVSLMLKDTNGPEGFVVLSDGTMIIAEQKTNRIVSLAPDAQTPTVLRTLPGTPSTAHCKDGVDNIALDATTNTLIVPDSPRGDVYRMSLDGKTFTKLASGIVRPVGATVDRQGTIFVADECGNAIWSISPAGKTTKIGGFGMPDDILLDGFGNALVIDLDPAIHALIRLNLSTGNREVLASQGFIEPQGLVMDSHQHIFVSDDFANIIIEYAPAP